MSMAAGTLFVIHVPTYSLGGRFSSDRLDLHDCAGVPWCYPGAGTGREEHKNSCLWCGALCRFGWSSACKWEVSISLCPLGISIQTGLDCSATL